MANANATTMTQNYISIVPGDANDWIWNSADAGDGIPKPELRMDNGIFVKSIQFHPSAQNDELIIREGSITGAIVTRLYCPEATPVDKIREFSTPRRLRPVYDYSECTFSTQANVSIMIEIA